MPVYISLLPMSLGTGSHLFLTISSFVFCKKKGKKQNQTKNPQPRLANSPVLEPGVGGHEGSVSCLRWRIVRKRWRPCQGSATLVEGGGVARLVSACPPRQATAFLGLSVLHPLQKTISSQKGGRV